MKIRSFCFIVCILSFSFITVAQKADTTGSAVFFQKVMAGINIKHANWVKSTAETVNEKNMTEAEVKTQATNYAVLENLNGADIEAMCFLVLMQAAKSAQEDLKAIMNKVQSINNQKKQIRDALATTQKRDIVISRVQLDSFTFLLIKKPVSTNTPASKTKPVSKMELDNLASTLKNDLDSMSEMGEMESLRLQMIMERLSKMNSTLSNLLKKISNITEQITQNLK